MGYTSYLQIAELLEDRNKSSRYFSEMRAVLDELGDEDHVILAHISLSLTPGSVVIPQINEGQYDKALAQFAAAAPLLGRPFFLRLGYEFNGHWNNYSARDYKRAWQRIESFLAANLTARSDLLKLKCHAFCKVLFFNRMHLFSTLCIEP